VAEGPSTSERLASAYKRLAASSEALNAASNQLSKPIAEAEALLQRLNIGLDTWQRVAGHSHDSGHFWSREIGYIKFYDGTWSLAIRATRGHEAEEEDHTEIWRFNDAPRSYRIEALDKLPDLLEELIKNADKTAKKLLEKTVEANELASALKQAADEIHQQKELAKAQKELLKAQKKERR
jgi:hypothetical protein